MMHRAFKFRLYPNKRQREYFENNFGACRFIWNKLLEDSMNDYKLTGKLCLNTPAMYKSDYTWLRDVDSLALTSVWQYLNQAYKSFFSNQKKHKKKSGHPKFKKKDRCKKSYTTNLVNGNIVVYDNAIKLPKIGKVKAVIHREIPDDYKLKRATVSQDPDGTYHCSLLYEFDKNIKTNVDTNKSIGLDYSSHDFYVASDNTRKECNKYYRNSQKKLRRAQKRLARKQGFRKGEVQSANYKKQLMRLNKIYAKISHQRNDALQKLSTEIANRYDIVCVETLDLTGIANRKRHLGKATLDNGWGNFLFMLEYKQKFRGHLLVKINRWFPSSQLCHCCHAKNPLVKNLKIRTWTCPNCSAVHDRDVNAAINILDEGLRLVNAGLLA